MKRLIPILLVFVFIFVPSIVSASGLGKIGEYIPPSDSDFYQTRFSVKLGVNESVQTIKIYMWENQEDIENYKYKEIRTFSKYLWEGKNHIWVDFYWSGIVEVDYLNNRSESLGKYQFVVNKTYIANESSSTHGANLTKYDESQNKYTDDRFGEPPVPNPPDPTDPTDPGETEEPNPTEPEEPEPQQPNTDGFFDWDFFWGMFGFLLKIQAPFVMLIIAIMAVGLLLFHVISAVRK